MNKLLITVSSICLSSFALVGCHTLGNTVNTVETTSNTVVGGGVRMVGDTGRGLVAGTGAVVGTVVGGSMDLLTGKAVTRHDMRAYRTQGVVYRGGHQYTVQNGRYVLVR